jgi:hypothetical protein
MPANQKEFEMRYGKKEWDALGIKITESTNPKLQNLVTIANAVSRSFNRCRNTCILTSYALDDVLRRMGLNSYPLRVEGAVYPNDASFYCAVLGRAGGKAAKPGMWNGHLAVAIEKEWLLDPTLDQANRREWPACSRVGPAVVKLSDEFWQGKPVFISMNDSLVRYFHVKQHGFAKAPAARPSQWNELADRIMAKATAAGLGQARP